MFKVVIVDAQELKRRVLLGTACLIGILLTTCASAEKSVSPAMAGLPHAVSVNPPEGSALLNANTQAGDALGAILLPRLGSSGGILSATMVDLEDLDKSSALGRVSMQQIGSRLSQHGFRILETRLSSALRFEKKEGEFMLTRDSMLLLSNSYDAHAVLVGAYSESRDKIFLSVRVVRLYDSVLLAAYEYYLPKNGDAQILLNNVAWNNGSYTGDNEIWLRHVQREQAFVRKNP